MLGIIWAKWTSRLGIGIYNLYLGLWMAIEPLTDWNRLSFSCVNRHFIAYQPHWLARENCLTIVQHPTRIFHTVTRLLLPFLMITLSFRLRLSPPSSKTTHQSSLYRSALCTKWNKLRFHEGFSLYSVRFRRSFLLISSRCLQLDINDRSSRTTISCLI